MHGRTETTRQLALGIGVLALAVGATLPSADATPTRPTADAGGIGHAGVLLPASSSTGQTTIDEWLWLGPDGETHRFTTAELEDFLRTAEVLERVPINIGINGIDRLLLEKNGVRLRAGFRDVNVLRREERVGKEWYLVFRDHYAFECAAYELAKLLGLSNVPPAVLRRINRTDGSVQAWVESDLDHRDAEFKPPDALEWAKQEWLMRVFDALVYNVDRNPGNLISDNQYKLWMIDHTRAFQEKAAPFEVDKVVAVERGFWERMQALERPDVERSLGSLLETAQIGNLMRRRDALIEHISDLIATRGEDAVIY